MEVKAKPWGLIAIVAAICLIAGMVLGSAAIVGLRGLGPAVAKPETSPPVAAEPKALPPDVPKPAVYDWSSWVFAKKLSGPGGLPRCVAFSPDGRLLVAASDTRPNPIPTDRGQTRGVGGSLRVWSLPRFEAETAIEDDRCSFEGLGFSPDSRTLVASGRGDGAVFNAATWVPRYRFPGRACGCIGFASDGLRFTCGNRALWIDAGTGEEHQEPLPTTYWSAISPDGRMMSADGTDGTLIDLATGEHLGNTPGIDGAARRFTPDSSRLVAFGSGKLQVWDISARPKTRVIGETEEPGASGGWLSVSSDGKAVVVGHGFMPTTLPIGTPLDQDRKPIARSASILSIPTLERLQEIQPPPGIIMAAFQPGGGHLAAIMTDGTVHVWLAATKP